MEDRIKIRPYRESDLEQVLALVRELEAEMAEKFPEVQIESGIETYRNRYLKKGNKYRTWVAVVDGGVVSYLMGYPTLGAPEIDSMVDVLPVSSKNPPREFYLQMTFVSRPYRNRGISKALHREVIEYARKKGFKEVYACIAKWNQAELRVIRSFKFHQKDLGIRYRLSLKF